MNNQELIDKFVTAAFYQLSTQDPLLATMLREVKTNISFSNPFSMGVGIDKATLLPVLHINPLLMEAMGHTTENAAAILMHEALHILNAHITSRSSIVEDMKLANIAMDMAINQYIKGLPDGCVNVNDFKTKDGQPMPKYRTFEVYLRILKETKDTTNKEQLSKFIPMDDHDWDNLTPEEKEQYNKNVAEIFKRSLDRAGNSMSPHGRTMSQVVDLHERESAKKTSIAELLKIVKKTLVLPDRTPTWTRANRRYGNFVPGFKKDQVPTVTIYLDSSGSISITEIREFSKVITSLLDTIPKKLKLANWHTEVYSFVEIESLDQATKTINESGGTDIDCVMRHIDANPCNLAIILTDGCYDVVSPCKSRDVVYLIVQGGIEDHPMKFHGRGTFSLGNLK